MIQCPALHLQPELQSRLLLAMERKNEKGIALHCKSENSTIVPGDDLHVKGKV
jgi:hypothetical protein